MTKEEIAGVVKKSKCKMLEGFNIEGSTRLEIIKHLKKACCPVLKKLLHDE